MNSTSQTLLNTAQPPSCHTFSAKEKDTETGYSYFGARYYDSDISVWLGVDPMADKYPSQSPYNYVGNRPIMVIDPNGMDEFELDQKTGKISKINENKFYRDGKVQLSLKNIFIS